MSRNFIGRLRSIFVRAQGSAPEPVRSEPEPRETELISPLDAFYRDKVQSNLRVLYRFAIQTRSLAIRDVIAKATSPHNLDLVHLINVITNSASALPTRCSFEETFDSSALLSLADLLSNTARDDLDTHAAISIYGFVYSVFGDSEFSDEQILLYVEALNEVGYYDHAKALAQEHSINSYAPLQEDLLEVQRIYRTSASIVEWLAVLNKLYVRLGMTQLSLLSDETLDPFDRLTVRKLQPVDGPKVSVIMPSFSPGDGIETAVHGLLEQTWQNLEIIIVNDHSPSTYIEVFTRLEKLDTRIKVLHLEQNAGAYVARNAGLALATGDFITTTDDDDWSHPDKIAAQVTVMLDDANIVATTSSHVRTTEELDFRRVNSSARFLQMNYSSLMFRREVISEIGDWDTVNRGADSEFYRRVVEYYGSDRVSHLSDKPLAFSRVSSGSLTSGEMYRGFIGTPRVLYLWATRQWRWDVGKLDQKPKKTSNTPRPYAVPTNFEAGQRDADLGLFDVIYVADFFRQAKHVHYALNEIKTLSGYGLRVGYIHVDSPRTPKPAGFPRQLHDLQLEREVTQISLEDSAEAKLLIVYDTSIGMFADQTTSNVVAQRCLVIERELPTLTSAAPRFPTDYPQALRNLDRIFDKNFEIVGASPSDQARLVKQVPPARLLSDCPGWQSHIVTRRVDIVPPSQRPVVGFHSYGNQYRWPKNSSIFRQVYISDLFETQLSGQVLPARQKFGEENFKAIRIVDFNSTSTEEFLAGIDFWVYYPNPKLQPEVWEPVLKAMDSGKVVILPPNLEEIYGEAAIYGSPNQVEKLVWTFSQDHDRYIRQAMYGQNFVQSKYSDERFYDRVIGLLNQ